VKPRALDLFCCAGGSAMGLFRAGFQVVGIDIEPQPHYPFQFQLGNAMDFDPQGFDFIWASPPCQAYTNAQRIRGREHPDLIEELRSRLLWFPHIPHVIENVPGAPLINPLELCGAMFGLKTYRHRIFECSFPIDQPAHPPHIAPVRKMGRRPQPGDFMHVVGNFSGVDQAREAMGIDWMPRDKFREAVPPAYSEYIGRAALDHIEAAKTA